MPDNPESHSIMAAPRVKVASEDEKVEALFDQDPDSIMAYKDAKGVWHATWESYVIASVAWPRRGRK